MFTGLVQSLATVTLAKPDGNGGMILTIKDQTISKPILGESIAINGCCLTVVSFDGEEITFQLGPETLAKTTFAKTHIGQKLNTERALKVGDSIGGHFVSGHVDCVSRIEKIEQQGEWTFMQFSLAEGDELLCVDKGSIAIDGISLTLVSVQTHYFTVMLIPHTRAVTSLGFKSVGDEVHLEFDMMAKQIHKLFSAYTSKLKSKS